jgi:hypothetical protein
MLEHHNEQPAATPASPRAGGAMFRRFRYWRETAVPLASYQILPRFWTPAGREQVQGIPEALQRANKTFEPSLTGIAWTEELLYLIIAARAADYEHVGRLVHCRILVRHDVDYAEHQGKRISAIVLCDQAPAAVLDFARRMRVHVVTISPTISPRDAHRSSVLGLDR